MNDIFEANKTLLSLTQQLISKVKVLKKENEALSAQIAESSKAVLLSDEQKTEIERLLIETKSILELEA